MKNFISLAVTLFSLNAFSLESQQELALFLDHQDHIEVQASKLAIERSTNEKILAYAHRVYNNHILANRVLVSLAKAENLTLNSSGTFDIPLMNLKNLQGEALDRNYALLMVAIHELAVTNIDESEKLKHTPVGAFAQVIRSRVADGLVKAREL